MTGFYDNRASSRPNSTSHCWLGRTHSRTAREDRTQGDPAGDPRTGGPVYLRARALAIRRASFIRRHWNGAARENRSSENPHVGDCDLRCSSGRVGNAHRHLPALDGEANGPYFPGFGKMP